MRALFVQQDHVSPPGPVGDRLSQRGYSIEEFLVVPADLFHAPDVTVTFPDPTDYDLIVPMGAPWSVYDHSSIGAWVLEELTFLRRAHEAEIPIFAICFGAQALAQALGGSVIRADEAEVGWHEIDTDDPSLVSTGPWLQWHHDRWMPPPGAMTIARTARADQVYLIGRSMGVQFHPEFTPDQLEGWIANGGQDYLDQHGPHAGDLIIQSRAIAEAAAERTHHLVDQFLDRVATITPGSPGGA